ncbi:hypothetical protein PSAC2689_110222 [Paraburkholderia sacchari]
MHEVVDLVRTATEGTTPGTTLAAGTYSHISANPTTPFTYGAYSSAFIRPTLPQFQPDYFDARNALPLRYESPIIFVTRLTPRTHVCYRGLSR